MTISKASLSKVQYTTPIADFPNPPIVSSTTDVGTSRGYNNGAASIAFTADEKGGTAVDFTATSVPGGYTVTSASSPLVVEGLQSATSYTFDVVSNNATATGYKTTTSSITATTVPDAPIVGTATVVDTGTITLGFTAPATGGSAITSYTVQSSPSIALTTAPGTTSPVTVTGSFYSSQEYTFTIAANNANGTSVYSSSSNGITPVPQLSFTTNYLVVAGGGSGGIPAGGGAGGFRTSSGTSGANSSAEASLTLLTGVNYSCTVGAGGAYNANGSDSVFSTITSTRGGRMTQNGGSGGGNGGLGTANQGRNGSPSNGGGGGSSGLPTSQSQGRYGYRAITGGAGQASSITGSSVTYAGGGGEGVDSFPGSGAGSGGTGGGGYGGYGYPGSYGGSWGPPAAGTANRGAGGGGGVTNNNVGAAGGSGVVILRYPSARLIALSGLSGSTITDGSEKVTTITSGSGTVSWT